MTSKTIALKILDSIFIAASTFLLLLVAGLPAEWIMALLGLRALTQT